MLFSAAFLTACLAGAAVASPVVKQRRALPDPVDVATAKTYLGELKVAEEVNDPPYERDYFHTWITIDGSCDTRETVLKRDGTDVETDSSCKATSGSWVSPYDNVATTDPSDLDIDHVVPLKELWVSGASAWTDEQREAIANDLERPQLVAVTDNLNQSKGDQDVAEWVPPLESFVCTYVQAWVTVKHYYELSIDQAEKDALTSYLDKC